MSIDTKTSGLVNNTYWDILGFIIPYFAKLETAWSILKTRNLGKQKKKKCYIPHTSSDESPKSWRILPLRRVNIYCFSLVEDNCDKFHFLPYLLYNIF